MQVMRAAAASIKVLRPGGHWRIAVPDAYFPKYFSLMHFFQVFLLDAYSSKHVSLTPIFLSISP